MLKTFTETGWEDYCSWQINDRKTLKKVNALILDIERHPFDGLGKPEPLKHDYSGYWSRRIDEKNRLVYKISGENNETLIVLQCKEHY